MPEADLGLLHLPRWRALTKRSILDVAAALDPTLNAHSRTQNYYIKTKQYNCTHTNFTIDWIVTYTQHSGILSI